MFNMNQFNPFQFKIYIGILYLIHFNLKIMQIFNGQR